MLRYCDSLCFLTHRIFGFRSTDPYFVYMLCGIFCCRRRCSKLVNYLKLLSRLSRRNPRLLRSIEALSVNYCSQSPGLKLFTVTSVGDFAHTNVDCHIIIFTIMLVFILDIYGWSLLLRFYIIISAYSGSHGLEFSGYSSYYYTASWSFMPWTSFNSVSTGYVAVS